MKNKQLTLLVVLTILFVTTSYAQHVNYNIKNGFAIGGGVSLFNIKTDNFVTSQSSGFVASMSATVDIPHRWYTVSYGMQFSENNIEVSGRVDANGFGDEMIKYKLKIVQLGFLFHGKIVGSHLTIDAGPQLQYNGKLEFVGPLEEPYLISGYDNLKARDISNISQFNVNGAVGLTAGFGPLKLRAQYIYGFLNILDKLNDKAINADNTVFKGNPETLMLTALFTF